MTRTARLSLLIGLFAVCVPAVSFGAGLLGPKKTALEKLEDGDAIRNRYMLRGGRFELSPGLGFVQTREKVSRANRGRRGGLPSDRRHMDGWEEEEETNKL